MLSYSYQLNLKGDNDGNFTKSTTSLDMNNNNNIIGKQENKKVQLLKNTESQPATNGDVYKIGGL